MMTHDSKVPRSWRYTPIYLLIFQKKVNCQEVPMLLFSDQHFLSPQQYSCVLRSWNSEARLLVRRKGELELKPKSIRLYSAALKQLCSSPISVAYTVA